MSGDVISINPTEFSFLNHVNSSAILQLGMTEDKNGKNLCPISLYKEVWYVSEQNFNSIQKTNEIMLQLQADSKKEIKTILKALKRHAQQIQLNQITIEPSPGTYISSEGFSIYGEKPPTEPPQLFFSKESSSGPALPLSATASGLGQLLPSKSFFGLLILTALSVVISGFAFTFDPLLGVTIFNTMLLLTTMSYIGLKLY